MKLTDTDLEALFCEARNAPPQPDTDAVSLGFETRLELRMRTGAAERSWLLPWRWAFSLLTCGFALCAFAFIFFEFARTRILADGLTDAWLLFL